MTMLLSNAIRLPKISYGTYKVSSKNMEELLDVALSAGYRSIDTAEGYRNEASIGAALSRLLPAHSLTRQDVFITSKLAPRSQGYERCQAAVAASLKALQTDYIDLYLIHWPGASGLEPDDPRHAQLRADSWRALEQLLAEGTLRAIGVSNYGVPHLQQLLDTCQTAPHVNQVEVHPYFQQKELREFCGQHKIHVQAYSSLGTTVEVSPLLVDPVVQQVAEEVGRTPAQVLLKWALQHSLSVIPKSTNPQHMRENLELEFSLDDQQMALLDGLERNTKFAWDSRVVA
ncbi:9,11-endoperoxide prostaglandin H2 reductase [Amphibalanus amphitrite]|uniref:9,11-endoperoxide prostaglandin H2 reductase n=1 Tax=Amphibalanus amphitrite TaxID=1232801 RepID=A0A6A4V4H9_AMPAM|nr:9,11-endoperoxide prostaglandin H2 reductase [Amphibalanus amphitrite]